MRAAAYGCATRSPRLAVALTRRNPAMNPARVRGLHTAAHPKSALRNDSIRIAKSQQHGARAEKEYGHLRYLHGYVRDGGGVTSRSEVPNIWKPCACVESG